MRTITESQLKILKALGRYMFLTVDLIDKLQIFKHKVSIYRAVQPLKEVKKPLVISQNFGIHPKYGQLPSLLYLSSYGKQLLIECGYEDYKIKLPQNRTFVSTDYFHRVSNISFFVQMDLYLKANNGHIIFLDYYFSKAKKEKGKYLQAKNRLDISDDKYIIPDIVTKFRINDRDYLYLVEIHNGKDSNKAFIQCLNYIEAIDLESVKSKYNYPRNNSVVFIFEYETCMLSVMKKMNDNASLKKYINLFLFKTIKSLDKSFENNWLYFNKRVWSFL